MAYTLAVLQYHEELLLSERGVGKGVRRGVTYTELGGRTPLSVGHLINHSSEIPSVRMIFVPMPKDFSKDLLSLVPSVNARPDRARRWVIAVVALRDMDADSAVTEAELFLNYGRNPSKMGWQVCVRFSCLCVRVSVCPCVRVSVCLCAHVCTRENTYTPTHMLTHIGTKQTRGFSAYKHVSCQHILFTILIHSYP
jgi:hypothetical protein